MTWSKPRDRRQEGGKSEAVTKAYMNMRVRVCEMSDRENIIKPNQTNEKYTCSTERRNLR